MTITCNTDKKRHIVIVEDDVAVVKTLELLLKPTYSLAFFTTVEDAYAYIQLHKLSLGEQNVRKAYTDETNAHKSNLHKQNEDETNAHKANAQKTNAHEIITRALSVHGMSRDKQTTHQHDGQRHGVMCKQKIDLIILDNNLAGAMYGIELLYILKSDSRLRDIPVIFQSADTGMADRSMAATREYLELKHIPVIFKNADVDIADPNITDANPDIKNTSHQICADLYLAKPWRVQEMLKSIEMLLG